MHSSVSAHTKCMFYEDTFSRTVPDIAQLIIGVLSWDSNPGPQNLNNNSNNNNSNNKN